MPKKLAADVTAATTKSPAKPAKKPAAKKKAGKEPSSWVVLEGAKLTLTGRDCKINPKYLRDVERQGKDGVKSLVAKGLGAVIEFTSPRAARTFYNLCANSDHDGIVDGNDTGWVDEKMNKAARELDKADED